jgi:hypothetical protein
VVLFAHRATEPKNVIDAKADGSCDGCGFPVWLAPSSHRVGQPICICCLHCLAKARGVVYGRPDGVG